MIHQSIEPFKEKKKERKILTLQLTRNIYTMIFQLTEIKLS